MGGPRILTDEQVDHACELREQGWSCQRIAEHFAVKGVMVSAGSISWACLVNGADLPLAKQRPLLAPKRTGSVVSRSGHLVRTFTPDEDQRLLELEQQHLNISEIARQMGRQPNSIRGRLATLARHDARAEAGEVG